MNTPSIPNTVNIRENGYWQHERSTVVELGSKRIEVVTGDGWTDLLYWPSYAHLHPRNISHYLSVLPVRTHEGAKQVAIAVITGQPAASVNREAMAG